MKTTQQTYLPRIAATQTGHDLRELGREIALTNQLTEDERAELQTQLMIRMSQINAMVQQAYPCGRFT